MELFVADGLKGEGRVLVKDTLLFGVDAVDRTFELGVESGIVFGFFGVILFVASVAIDKWMAVPI